MSLQLKNNAKSTINMGGGFAQAATTLTVTDGSKFPASGDFLVTIWDKTTYPDPGNDSGMEIVRVTARSTNDLTVVRAQEGTSDVAHANSLAVEMLITSGTLTEVEGSSVTETKTDNYTVTLADKGKTLVMNSAAEKTFSLPSVAAADIGIWFTFAKIAAGKLIIDAADSDKIADSGAGDTIYNDQTLEVYATIILKLISATQWAIIGADGIWVTTD
jgi:hypothetical protein